MGWNILGSYQSQHWRSTLVIDGKALVMVLGRPSECTTFYDHADTFLKAVLVCGKDYDRIDVTFDRYRETSIKCATTKKRSRGHAPIRRALEDGTVPLLMSWYNFLALDQNKADLARFLSEKIVAGAPVSKMIIVSAGFLDEDTVQYSRPSVDVRALRVSTRRRTPEPFFTVYTLTRNSLS